MRTLRRDGYAVFHAYDALSAVELALDIAPCHLLISNTRVAGAGGIELIHELRRRLPALPILYLAKPDSLSPAIESQLPGDVPILREPFTAAELRAAVRPLLPR